MLVDSSVAHARERRVRRAALVSTLLHTVPLGVVQFADYCSDLFVVILLYQSGHTFFSAAGTTFIILSVLAVCVPSCLVGGCLVVLISRGETGDTGDIVETRGLPAGPNAYFARLALWIILLSPFNLHVLFLGMEFSRLLSLNADVYYEHKRKLNDVRRKMRNYNAATDGPYLDFKERIKDAYRLLSQQRSARPFESVTSIFFLFITCKVLETALESIGLSIITAAALFDPDGAAHSAATAAVVDAAANATTVPTADHGAGGASAPLLYSSLCLSTLSMAYGFFSGCSSGFDFLGSMTFPQGRRLQCFLAFFAQVAWALAAFGSLWGTPGLSLGVRLGVPLALIALPWLVVIDTVRAFTASEWNSARSRAEHIAFASFLIASGLLASIIGLAVDPAVFCASILEEHGHKNSFWLRVHRTYAYFLPLLRHGLLLVMAVVTLTHDFSNGKLLLLASVQLADAVATCFLFRALEVCDWHADWASGGDPERANAEAGTRPAACDCLLRGVRCTLSATNRAHSQLSAKLHGALALTRRRQTPRPPLPTEAQPSVPPSHMRGARLSDSPMAEHVPPTLAASDCADPRAAALRDGYIELLDMLDGVALASEDGDGSHAATRQALNSVCADVRASLARLSPADRCSVARALAAYVPSSTGQAEAALLERLRPPASTGEPDAARMASDGHANAIDSRDVRVDDGADGGGAAVIEGGVAHGDGADGDTPRGAADDDVESAEHTDSEHAGLPSSWGPSYAHPMRSVHLAAVLSRRVWASRPTVLGRTLERSSYALSAPAERADYFLSHAWRDSGARKVSMLREFLCLQALFGRTLVVLPVLALFLLPLGFGIASLNPAFPFYALAAGPVGLIGLIWAWVHASQLGLVPAAYTPWGLTPAELWVDVRGPCMLSNLSIATHTCCICHDTPETAAAGIARFEHFLHRSDKMVAFVSPAYFERLWCVYELATFCRQHRERLRSHLLLLSLKWPSTLNPLKRSELNDSERAWFAQFSCLTAQCCKPSDRALLLAKIRAEWGSEANFNSFVRTELLEVMRQSKWRYQGQLCAVAKVSLELVFGE